MSKDKEESNNLAIIGASGTGKTVLAVGLYATSTPEFTVSPVGEETRKYIEVRQTALEEGYWPSATNESENLDLRLRLHAAGKQTDIVFREYMGERMEQPNYIRDVIGAPKAAMILFNPGMPGLHSAEGRNKMIGNLKVIAQHLRDNKCAAVAFVVTASDRLLSDLSDFREDFERYVSDVTNHLGTLGLNWRRFDVTVSGRLDDQNQPKLARGDDNTTRAPFLWLLNRIRNQKNRAHGVRIAKCGAGLVVAAFVVAGALWWRSKSLLSDIRSDIECIESQLADAWKTKDESAVNCQLRSLWTLNTNSLPVVLKFGSSNRELARVLALRVRDDIDIWSVRSLSMVHNDNVLKLDTNPLSLSVEWAKDFDNRLKLAKPSETNAIAELHELRLCWEGHRSSMEEKWQVAKLKSEIDKNVQKLESSKNKDQILAQLKNGFEFLKSLSRDYPLVKNGEVLSSRLNAARSNALARFCSIITKWSVTDENPPIAGSALKQEIKTSLLGRISVEELESTESALLVQQEKARVEWEAYQFPKRVKGDEAALKSAGANPVPALKASLVFLGSMTNTFSTIQPAQITQAKDAINLARKGAVIAYSRSLASKWDVNGKKPPEFNIEEVRNTTLTDVVVTGGEWDCFESDIQNRFSVAKWKWDKNQQRLVEQFNVNGDIRNVVRSYGEFLDENPNNPYLEKLHNRMSNRLIEYFRGYIRDYYEEFTGSACVWNETYAKSRMERAQNKFNEFRAVCLMVTGNGWSGSPLRSSRVGKFARLCVECGNLQKSGIAMAFEQTVKVTRVMAKFEPTQLDDDYIQMIFSGDLTAKRWDYSTNVKECIARVPVFSSSTIRKRNNGEWVELWSGLCSVKTNPWTLTSFELQYEDHQEAFWSKGSEKYYYYPRLEYGPHWENNINIHLDSGGLNTNTQGKLSLRITYSREGPDFYSLWKEAGLGD